MKIQELCYSVHESNFLINEVTGELDELLPNGTRTVHIEGEKSPETFCRMIFDQSAIEDGWAPLKPDDAKRRIQRHEAKVFSVACDLTMG